MALHLANRLPLAKSCDKPVKPIYLLQTGMAFAFFLYICKLMYDYG